MIKVLILLQMDSNFKSAPLIRFDASRPVGMSQTMIYTPLVHVHLVREDLPAALAEFERICREHKVRPVCIFCCVDSVFL
jgi:hypothetical protein